MSLHAGAKTGEANCSIPAAGYLKDMFLEGEGIFIDPPYGQY
jgi:hypothetical protein